MFFLRHREFLSDVCRTRDDVHVNSKLPGSDRAKEKEKDKNKQAFRGRFG